MIANISYFPSLSSPMHFSLLHIFILYCSLCQTLVILNGRQKFKNLEEFPKVVEMSTSVQNEEQVQPIKHRMKKHRYFPEKKLSSNRQEYSNKEIGKTE